jgi:hypothetical protein
MNHLKDKNKSRLGLKLRLGTKSLRDSLRVKMNVDSNLENFDSHYFAREWVKNSMSSSDERKRGYLFNHLIFFNHLTNFIQDLKTKTIRLEELPEENEDSDE